MKGSRGFQSASNASVRAAIRAQYDSSVGVTLAEAGPGDDRFDLPRIEMFYFRDMRRWRAHLAGTGRGYLRARRESDRARRSFQAILAAIVRLAGGAPP